MSKLTINVGASANDGTGDTLRVSQQKANSNFTELYDRGLQEVTDINATTTNAIDIGALTINSDILDLITVNYDSIDEEPIITFNNINNGTSQTFNIPFDNNCIWSLPRKSGSIALVDPSDNFANDTAAATGGIGIGQYYHTSGVVKIRLT
jgi:hypothetical protein